MRALPWNPNAPISPSTIIILVKNTPSQTSSNPTPIHSNPPPLLTIFPKPSPASTIPVSPQPTTPRTKNIKNPSYTPYETSTRARNHHILRHRWTIHRAQSPSSRT
ncbi:a2c31de3-5480-426e-977c-846a98f0d498-CDS [Sclerotinia trifoliorum]|uniref:A2c31de3-5480-426e-977c-846a98f0d498-CDS n=1 Tax=Sclerotinia trifoliorum TaxID=28548 RepID=A0A8H2VUF3_9HELO|nr:a2c31de3-5480-426e-977c-846a98f0d498-CDS [Sclerotinia trifoliorum]